MENKIKKEFEMFCKISGGEYREGTYIECVRDKYYIRLSEENGLTFMAGSNITSDFEILNIKNCKIIDCERLTKNNEMNELEYYIFNIYLDKGLLSIRRKIKEDKIIVYLKTPEIEYESSIVF